ncbi:MAG TPA: NAD-dependent deacylase [Oculatellaceae cyanobacterium]
MTENFNKALKTLTDLHRRQGRLVVLTGAGISKESGIPTFRDAQTGLWANYRPEELATREGFLKNPKMVWEWYDFRRNKVWDAQPNAGHRAIAELERLFKHFTLITQNIDNLHHRAGNRNVLELHGNIFRYKCLDNHHPVSLELLDEEVRVQSPPLCPLCNGYVRPDVVWFGEMLPERVLNQSFEAAAQAEVMLVVGTSGVVHPAASLPTVASEAGAVVIEVNPEMTALTPFVVDLFLQGPASELLGKLLDGLIAG